jgi:hypothetical protein
MVKRAIELRDTRGKRNVLRGNRLHHLVDAKCPILLRLYCIFAVASACCLRGHTLLGNHSSDFANIHFGSNDFRSLAAP